MKLKIASDCVWAFLCLCCCASSVYASFDTAQTIRGAKQRQDDQRLSVASDGVLETSNGFKAAGEGELDMKHIKTRMKDGKLVLVRPSPGPKNPYVELPPVQKDPKVVVTLTTTPSGAYLLYQVLDSLINQSYQPDEVHVNMPNSSMRGLGDYPDIEKLAWNWTSYYDHGIKVFRTKDWGALTNIIPTRARVGSDSRTLLIVVDDDKVLPATLVADHVRAFRRNPNSASTCRGYNVTHDMVRKGSQFGTLVNEISISSYGHLLAEPQRCGVVTGSDTWSVLASKFDETLWLDLDMHMHAPGPHAEQFEVGELASFMNDIWVSGMLSRKRVPKFVIPCSYETWDVIDNSGIDDRVGEYHAVGHAVSFASRDAKNAAVMRFFRFEWAPEEIKKSKRRRSHAAEV